MSNIAHIYTVYKERKGERAQHPKYAQPHIALSIFHRKPCPYDRSTDSHKMYLSRKASKQRQTLAAWQLYMYTHSLWCEFTLYTQWPCRSEVNIASSRTLDKKTLIPPPILQISSWLEGMLESLSQSLRPRFFYIGNYKFSPFSLRVHIVIFNTEPKDAKQKANELVTIWLDRFYDIYFINYWTSKTAVCWAKCTCCTCTYGGILSSR